MHCYSRGVDDYERTIVVFTAGGQDVSEIMVASGLAWAFRKYSDDYAAIEDEARQTSLQCIRYTATGASMAGCGSYPTTSKSSILYSSIVAGLRVSRTFGKGLGSR